MTYTHSSPPWKYNKHQKHIQQDTHTHTLSWLCKVAVPWIGSGLHPPQKKVTKTFYNPMAFLTASFTRSPADSGLSDSRTLPPGRSAAPDVHRLAILPESVRWRKTAGHGDTVTAVTGLKGESFWKKGATGGMKQQEKATEKRTRQKPPGGYLWLVYDNDKYWYMSNLGFFKL